MSSTIYNLKYSIVKSGVNQTNLPFLHQKSYAAGWRRFNWWERTVCDIPLRWWLDEIS